MNGRTMDAVCVYTGSQAGADPAFAGAARRLGELVAERGLTLVYGGARVGLMGTVADAALGAGGRVVGVIPRRLVDREIAHEGVELRVVDSMHERKRQMAAEADAFVALPGGIGTLEELFETWTWRYLGLHDKPLGLLDVNGFYAKLIDFLDDTVAAGLLRPHSRSLLISDDDPGRLLDRLGRPAA